MPEVTVLLAAPEGGPAAMATVRDLLGQTLGDIELLVLAAGDRGPWAELAGEDARVRIVPAEGEGLGEALNRGLALAQAGLVVRAVPGDLCAPERLARQAGLLRAAAEVSFVGAGWRAVGLDGTVRRVVSPPAGDAALRAALATGDAIGHPTAMMRRDAVVRAGGWRPAFVDMEDYDLLLRLLDRHAGACTPEPLVDHVADAEEPDWRALQQRILSEMAAATASDRRQAGRPDQGDRSSPADRGLLHRMGMVDEEITRQIIARALSLSVAAGSAGRWRAMREAARLGLEQEGVSGPAKSGLIGLWLRGLARLRPVAPGPGAPPTVV